MWRTGFYYIFLLCYKIQYNFYFVILTSPSHIYLFIVIFIAYNVLDNHGIYIENHCAYSIYHYNIIMNTATYLHSSGSWYNNNNNGNLFPRNMVVKIIIIAG